MLRYPLLLILIFSFAYAQENLRAPVALLRSGTESGAAFIVGEQGGQLYLLTAAHVIDDAQDITLTFRGRGQQPARVVNSDFGLDIAVISCPRPSGFSPVSYPISTNPILDDQAVVIIGHPLGNDWDINKINQVKESAFGINPGRFTVYPTGIGPGSSGGPVLDANGQLLGLVTEVDQVKTICVQVDVLLRACKKWAVPVNSSVVVSAQPKPSLPVAAAASTYTDPLAGTMVRVDGGTFAMGENPSHSVTISDFYIGKYEVTQAQWKAVMGMNPSSFKNCDQCPVEQVSWNDIQTFLQKLNQQTGKQYRLPTEAEWEYAAGGGENSRTKWAGTNREGSLGDYAWYSGNSDSKTHPVGQKKENALGLHDMSGNVWEWCEDDWHGTYQGAPKNGQAWVDTPRGSYRVFRGGGWFDSAVYCRVAYRNNFGPSIRLSPLGFRLARSF